MGPLPHQTPLMVSLAILTRDTAKKQQNPKPITVSETERGLVGRPQQTETGRFSWNSSQVFINTILSGRGALLLSYPAQSTRISKEKMNTSVFELRAVRKALICFQSDVNGWHVCIRMDSISSKTFINKQRSSRSSILHTSCNLSWAEKHPCSNSAEHIKGP